MNRKEIIYQGESTVEDIKIKIGEPQKVIFTPSGDPKDPDPNNPGDYKVEQVAPNLDEKETIDWGLEMLSIPDIWKETQGGGIKIAVLDSGITYFHPDLKGAFKSVINCRDFTGSPSGAADMTGHGTHVAGIIAAQNNNIGIVGVAPMAKLIIGKVLGDNGCGSFEALANGIRWAITHKPKPDIISISLGCHHKNDEIECAIREANEKGIIVICAAGNTGPNLDTVDYPAKFEDTVAVGAIGREKKITRFSSRGPQVDIVAPGDQILSTYPPAHYAILSGTSMATPFVSGVVALMLAKHRNPKYNNKTQVKTPKDVVEHLRKTAIDLGPDGLDSSYGFGLINPMQLLNLGSARALNFIDERDFTKKGQAKLRQFFGNQVTANGNYLQGSIGDKAGESRIGIQVKL